MLNWFLACWVQFILYDFQELPPQVLSCRPGALQRSHNNVDLTFFRGEYYLVLRAAPTHFPSRKAELRILRSTDLTHWICDTAFCVGQDLREPRWLIWKDSLYLYFFGGSASSWKFKSEGIQGAVWQAPGQWSFFSVGWKGWVPWRARPSDSVAYLSVYWGENLYGTTHRATVRLLSSTDGRHWQAISDAPQLTEPHATETDFWIEKDGRVWAVARAEGRGSYLCFAPHPTATWKAVPMPVKYDSPLLFSTPTGLYLVARRHLPGRADRAPRFFPALLRRYYNLILYSCSRKRTALYRVDTANRRIEWIQDLPGWGDTAFPAIYPYSGRDFVLVNYTSPLSKEDRWWIRGQLGRTTLYRIRLRLADEEEKK
ncbi:MAG: hypothetical protein RMK19_01135 [Bacteroidia bacterium]|nr:hypothetical protein [Bacteroidia bacterium]MDW8014598.1 hypothetical protein [Bacteroidia bacterium]